MMNYNTADFEEIRPFRDDEVASVIERLTKEPSFYTALRYVFPEAPTDILLGKIKGIKSIDSFQEELIAPAIRRIIRNTTKGLRHQGLDSLNAKKSYLFISNHRDIVMDSAFMNFMLFEENLPTTRIAIGNNLLQRSWIEALVKLNKNFIVHRNVHARQAYAYSLRLSNYIRNSIVNENSSIWIAQREGRTKDGIDQTQAGLLKMFSMSSEEEYVKSFSELHIVPVSISYEFEPCVGLKAQENLIRLQTGTYLKKEGEDLLSMKEGIAQQKGRVVYCFSKELEEDELQVVFATHNKNEAFKNLAQLIDNRIIENYKLFPNNYIAYDLLHGVNQFTNEYTRAELEAFHQHVDEQGLTSKINDFDFKQAVYSIYAAPLHQKERIKSAKN
jgi:hypothetical protein